MIYCRGDLEAKREFQMLDTGFWILVTEFNKRLALNSTV
jgi:hypothetical protein